ncbi:MAG TPA: DUF4169 family protein [Acetobacteraceae bacterium]|nr:DUF4169 family protein [Acetobacteraceae bacterium]
MGEIVNLRRVKKRKVLQAAEAAAAENRIRHGRTGAQKTNDRRAAERLAQLVEGARRDKP